ncbi:uncharacterized protein LOC116431979 [Nomia melanderi]|uniref:uncharacterized protein LOC116431979 n=1 Tax=Nomia melanderi TaxID=2448451 RepID=UPI001304699A|nr:uncharacterized protein LOC116431979 [Nomia melanderi]
MTVSGSVNRKQVALQQNENLNTSSSEMVSKEMKDLKDSIAIRFLLKRTKRFDHWKEQKAQKKAQRARLTLATDTAAECLKYLGLTQKNMKKRERPEQRQEDRSSFQFPKPMVYECEFCTKVFFHKIPYRRHMIRHMKKQFLCMKCNQGFSSKLAKRRHNLSCR